MPPIIDDDACVRCEICVDVCPEDVFNESRPRELPMVTYPHECFHCAACVVDCPAEAITLYIPLPMRL